MIKGILIVNNHGKPRIVKFYEHVVRLLLRLLYLLRCSRESMAEEPRPHVLSRSLLVVCSRMQSSRL